MRKLGENSISTIKRDNDGGRDGETEKEIDITLDQVGQGKRQRSQTGSLCGRLFGIVCALCIIVNDTVAKSGYRDQILLFEKL